LAVQIVLDSVPLEKIEDMEFLKATLTEKNAEINDTQENMDSTQYTM
jgi:hypothetical protein